MTEDLILQQPGSALIFEALANLSRDDSATRLRLAVALATRSGVKLLQKALLERGSPVHVLAVVGLDRSMTEPVALQMMLNEQHIELRTFSSRDGSMFHPKIYAFDRAEDVTILSGSANLTAHALTRNHEVATITTLANSSPAAVAWEQWWDQVWAASTLCDQSLIDKYAPSYHPQRSSAADNPIIGEEESPVASPRVANELWLGTGSMTGGGITQLELPRAAAGFFVDPADVTDSRVLTLLSRGSAWPDNQLSFYVNEMWRINLNGNIPEVAADVLRYSYVIFRRTRRVDVYEFEVLREPRISELRNASQVLEQYGQTTTRDYGWL